MTCKREQCPNPVVARGLCRTHYNKWAKTPEAKQVQARYSTKNETWKERETA